jgi:energy-converting hydrogenase Eha subunit F
MIMAVSETKDPNARYELWPSLPLEEWKDTYATLHMWTQIVGKIRLKLAPPLNHWWHCALYISESGLITSAMPYRGRLFEIEFDFIDHQLHVRTDDKQNASLTLAPRSVADFYQALMSTLASLGIEVSIYTKPQEVPNPIPFEKDTEHASYDPEYANRFWRILAQTSIIFEEFRGRFVGKCSPVNFFWGSLDSALTRFSGRPAPPRPGLITSEAYSHECISAGFWPGAGYGAPAFYSYTAPAPPGLEKAPITSGFYSQELKEFVLPYDEVRKAESPRDKLLDFLQTTYEAGAKLAKWDRAALERQRQVGMS